MDNEVQRLEDQIRHSDKISEARLETALARIDGTFTKIDGTFAKIETRLDHIEKSTSGLRSTIFGTGIGIVALVAGVMAYGQAWFGTGLTTRDLIKSIVVEQMEQENRVKN